MMEVSQVSQAVNFEATMSDILCPLLGTNHFTKPHEYCIRKNLKLKILNTATDSLQD